MESQVFNGHRVSVWADEEVLEMDGDDGCTSVNEFNATKPYT